VDVTRFYSDGSAIGCADLVSCAVRGDSGIDQISQRGGPQASLIADLLRSAPEPRGVPESPLLKPYRRLHWTSLVTSPALRSSRTCSRHANSAPPTTAKSRSTVVGLGDTTRGPPNDHPARGSLRLAATPPRSDLPALSCGASTRSGSGGHGWPGYSGWRAIGLLMFVPRLGSGAP
jgi:hypothetical protein